MNKDQINQLSRDVVDACFSVHRTMGPGLLESIYEECLMKEFQIRGISASNQINIPLTYRKYRLSKDFRIDMLVGNEIIIEVKSIETILPVHEAQIISYLKLSGKRLGFLVNFNVPILKAGIKRFVNNLDT